MRRCVCEGERETDREAERERERKFYAEQIPGYKCS